MMKKKWWRRLLRVLAIAICVIPPVKVTIDYIPLWIAQSSALMAVFEMVIPSLAIVVFFFCALPLIKFIIRHLKSPSAWFIWSLMFVIFEAISKVIDQIRVITFVGAVCNIIGVILWKISYIGTEEK